MPEKWQDFHYEDDNPNMVIIMLKKSVCGLLTSLLFLIGSAGCGPSAGENAETSTAQAESIAQTAIAGLLSDFTKTSEAMATITQRPDQMTTATSTPDTAPTNALELTVAVAPVPVVTSEPVEMASFISETIPDDTEVDPGDIFTKTWVLKNSGETTWTASYLLVFVHGEQMGAPEWVAIGQQVLPGEEIQLSLTLTAPLDPGTHSGYWKLSNPSGGIFGVEPQGSGAFYVQISVPYADTKTPTATEAEETATETPVPDTATPEPTAEETTTE